MTLELYGRQLFAIFLDILFLCFLEFPPYTSFGILEDIP